ACVSMPRTGMDALAERIVERIRREGPIPFDRFVDTALYHEPGGFFARGGGAGRAGRDFVTSPQVGALFGALVARFLDRGWAARPVAGVGPIVAALPELPALEIESGVVVANELLDNLPFRIVERTGDAWAELRVGLGQSGFVEVAVPASSEVATAADEVAAGV